MKTSRVGKILYIFCLLIGSLSTFLEATVSLELCDEQGNKISQAYVGQAFTLEVVLSNSSKHIAYPHVKGLEAFVVKKTGFQMQSINRVTSTRYRYEIRIDTPGTYTLGPAVVIDNNSQLASETITLEVVPGTQKIIGKKEKIWASLQSKQNQYWLGQKIELSVRVYGIDSKCIEAIVIPEELKSKAFVCESISDPILKREEIAGKVQQYCEWTLIVYTTQPGSLVIPAFFIEYKVKPKKRHHFFGFFSAFKKKRIQTNALTFVIEPLPKHVPQGTPVGTIEKVVATIENSELERSKATVFTLTVQGEVPWHLIPLNSLEKMPIGVRWYPSKQETMANQKKGEFVIQALQKGTWTIPSQKIYYFNVDSGQYTYVQTEPKTMIIKEIEETTKTEKSSGESVHSTPDITIPSEATILALNEKDYWWSKKSSKGISCHKFIIVTIIPLLIYILLIIGQLGFRWFFYRRSFLCNNAHRKIEYAEKEQNYKAVYGIMLCLCNQLQGASGKTISHDEVFWQKQFKDPQMLMDWKSFVETIHQLQFVNQQVNSQINIFSEAHMWIERWKK